MGFLIIGHVTANTARVWVRGDKASKEAHLRYRERKPNPDPWTTASTPLVEHRGFIEVIELSGLRPSTAYECELSYQAGAAPAVKAGAFRTAPGVSGDVSFLVGSCNWSRGGLIKIGNAKKAWEGIAAVVDTVSPDFMIHCGDQVYADIIAAPPAPFMHLRYYRELYQKAWSVKPTAQVLARLPHYMVLDDHEIFDNFFNGKPYAGENSDVIRDFAKQAYKEYQHSRNPQTFSPAFYYSFDYAGAQFFALDLRTERHVGANATICGSRQMADFKSWLLTHKRALKFVVTSIPFVGEARDGNDKWCGTMFSAQRDEIIDFVAANGIDRLVFLTGDMHCSYHATMTVKATAGDITVHELMSSPINQATSGLHQLLETATRTTSGGVRYDVALDPTEFYGAHSNVMHVKAAESGRVTWEIYRTKEPGAPPAPTRTGTFVA